MRLIFNLHLSPVGVTSLGFSVEETRTQQRYKAGTRTLSPELLCIALSSSSSTNLERNGETESCKAKGLAHRHTAS